MSQSNFQVLTARVQVLFGVDATDLMSTLPQEVREEAFDRVIFQFPQHKERNKAPGTWGTLIHLNRELLRTFLREAKALLAPAGEAGNADTYEIKVVCSSQGNDRACATVIRRPKDTWQAQEMGLEAGDHRLLLTRVAPCPQLEQLGYESTGSLAAGPGAIKI
eukprot:Skav216425  [mRNA]  locus=scaffold3139:249358:256330:- [translate_table: standard]